MLLAQGSLCEGVSIPVHISLDQFPHNTPMMYPIKTLIRMRSVKNAVFFVVDTSQAGHDFLSVSSSDSVTGSTFFWLTYGGIILRKNNLREKKQNTPDEPLPFITNY